MSLATQKKTGVVTEFRRAATDTGSPEVQVALLSARINGLGDHFGATRATMHSRRGLLKMVNQRRKLFDYLKATRPSSIRRSSAAWVSGANYRTSKAALLRAAFFVHYRAVDNALEAFGASCQGTQRESSQETFQYGPHDVTIETGDIARQADGASSSSTWPTPSSS